MIGAGHLKVTGPLLLLREVTAVPRMSAFEHRDVLTAGGQRLGRVGSLLFHPSDPRVIGIQIDRSALLGVIDRPPLFAPWSDVIVDGEVLRLPGDRPPKDAAGERVLGYSWHDTVIWQGMPVRSQAEDPVGVVADALFERESGELITLVISTGAVGDLALGRLEVSRELVQGFDGESVRVRPGYNEIRSHGGAAKAAAAGAAAVKVRAGQVGEGALQVGVAASRALGRSLKHGSARKAIDKLKSLMGDEE